jgi:hypothetical protein
MPCVFCGGSPVTAEHVWPGWLTRAAPAPRPLVTQLQRRTDHTRRAQPAPRQWVAPAYSVTVRVPCASCNNGWMSELEKATRPLLEPMLHGDVRILDQERQAQLAAWAFKTTAMLEFTYPQERAIQAADLEWLFEHQEPPASVRIWIASYRGVERNVFYRHDVMQLGRPAEDTVGMRHDAPLPPPVAYGVTFGVRHVAFQLFGTTRPSLRVHHEGIAAQAFEQIWPTRTAFTWPPDIAIGDDDLPHVLQMFRRGAGRQNTAADSS